MDELPGTAHSRGYLNRLFHAEFSVSASVALERPMLAGGGPATRTDLTIAIAHRAVMPTGALLAPVLPHLWHVTNHLPHFGEPGTFGLGEPRLLR